jgi:hypothetical protein
MVFYSQPKIEILGCDNLFLQRRVEGAQIGVL